MRRPFTIRGDEPVYSVLGPEVCKEEQTVTCYDVEPIVINELKDRITKCNARRATGNLPWLMSDQGPSDLEKAVVLGTECGEVLQATQDRYKGTHRGDLKHELLDVAACAIMWLCAIEEKAG